MSFLTKTKQFLSSPWTDKDFIKSIKTLALPLLIANIINYSLQFVDQIMLSFLGTTITAAAGYVNQIYFLFIVIFFAIAASSGVFFSRLWKQQNIKAIKEVQAISIYVGLTLCALFIICVNLWPEKILKLYTKDPEVINHAALFLKNLSYGQPFLVIAYIYTYLTRSAEHPKIATRASIISFLSNTILNYILIFGHFGFPQLGILGASIATNIARIILFIYIIWQCYAKIPTVMIRFTDLFSINKKLLLKVLNSCLGLILSNSIWALAFNIYIGIFGHMSTQAGASYSIILSLRNLFMIFVSAITPSCMILIGHKIGENKNDILEIRKVALKFQSFNLSLSIFLSIFSIVLLPILIHNVYFSLDPIVQHNILYMGIILGVVLPVVSTNNVFGAGIFRAGGDFYSNMAIIIICNIMISSTLGYFASIVFKKPALVLLFIYIGDIIRLFLNVILFNMNKWLKIKEI